MATNQYSITIRPQLARLSAKVKVWVKGITDQLAKHTTVEFGGIVMLSQTVSTSSTNGSDPSCVKYNQADKVFYYDNGTTKYNNWTGADSYGTHTAKGITPVLGKVYTYGGKAYIWDGTSLVSVGATSSTELSHIIGTLTQSDLNTGTDTTSRLSTAKVIADFVKAKVKSCNDAIQSQFGNYYTKSEVGSMLNDKLDSSDITELESKVNSLEASVGGKANSNNVYTKAEVNTKIDEVNAKIASVYKPAGSCAFSSLPGLSQANKAQLLGNVYNVTDAFTTSSFFADGAGKHYPANTNVVVVEISGQLMFDCLSGVVDLSAYSTTADADVKYAAKVHNHAISSIQGLQAALDAKQDELDYLTDQDILDMFADIQTGSQDSVTQIFTIADDAAIDAIFESRNVID